MRRSSSLTTQSRAGKIAALNDDFRKHYAGPSSGKVVITPGVTALGGDTVIGILNKVRAFNDFNKDNDPHHEHDFGAIEYDGHKLFFKIDYYDASMQYGSEDPTDSKKTLRVLTVMLAEEY